MLIKKKSKIDCTGVFTDKKILEGVNFYDIPIDKTEKSPHQRWARIGDEYICDKEVLNYVNHSCNPNAKIDSKNFRLTALKDIAAGDEIVVDYDKTEIDGDPVKCNCQSENCRGSFKREY